MLGLTADELGFVLLAISTVVLTATGGDKARRIVQGKSAPPPSPGDMVEVAGAIVSPRDVQEIVTALKGTTSACALLAVAIDRDVEAKGKLTVALNRNSDVCEAVHEQAKDVGARLEQLKTELIRNTRR